MIRGPILLALFLCAVSASATEPSAAILARPALFREAIQIRHASIDSIRKALGTLELEHVSDCENLYTVTSLGEVAVQASDACSAAEVFLNIDEVSGVTRRSAKAQKIYLVYFKMHADILRVLTEQATSLATQAHLDSLRRLASELVTAVRSAEQLMRGRLGTD
jgi:hypothetical protein